MIKLTYLGTNCILINDHKTKILIDPCFTRPHGIAGIPLVIQKAAANPYQIQKVLQKIRVSTLNAVLLTHTHYDHALDAAETARKTQARLIGSSSARNIGLGAGLPTSQILMAIAFQPIQIEDFQVTFIPSRHLSFPAFFNPFVDVHKPITRPLQPPAYLFRYHAGDVYNILIRHPQHSTLVIGSAGYIPDQLIKHPVDSIIVGIGGLNLKNKHYWQTYFNESVIATGAKQVFISHWDDFTRGIEEQPRFIHGCQKVSEFFIQKSKEIPSINESRLLLPWEEIYFFQ